MTTATLEAKPPIRRRGRRISPPRRQAAVGARVQAARAGAVPGSGRVPRRRLVHERPPHRKAAPRIHGLSRHRLDRARFPFRQRGAVSGLGAGHQLRGALGQGARPRSENAARPDRHFRPIERRPSGDAGRHAPARSALCRDRAAGRRAGAGRQRALRRDVVAGDQSAVALPPRQARAGERRRMGERASSRATIPIGAPKPTWKRAIRCWRSSAARKCNCRRRSGSRRRGDIVHDYKDADFEFPRQRAATFRRQLQKGRRRHRAANISRWSATPAIRRT